MKKYSIFESLSKMSRWEIRAFKKFMQSEYFVSETKRKVFDAIIKYSPHFNDSEITLNKIYEDAFLEAYSEGQKHKITNSFSDLNILIERFRVCEFLDEKKNIFHLEKLKAVMFYAKDDFRAFEKKALAALKNVEDDSHTFTSFEKQSLLNLLHYYPYERNKDLSPTHLQEANNSLDVIYIINKLRYRCEFISRQHIYKNQEGVTFEKEVNKIAEKLKEKNVLIDLYLNIIALYSNQEENTFLEIKEKFILNISNIPRDEAATIIVLLTNFTNYQYAQKLSQYFQYQIELYQLGLDIEHKLFMTKGYITHGDFMNILITAIGVGNLDFAEKFIKENKKFLKPNYQEGCEKLGQAYILFKQKKYGKALKIISPMTKEENRQIFFALRIRFLELRCIFELFILDPKYPFQSKYKAFYAYIEKNKHLSSAKITAYLNHLKILNKITSKINQSQNISQKHIKELRKEIMDTFPLVGWEYLLEKINSL